MIALALVCFVGAGIGLFWLEEQLQGMTRSDLAEIWVESFLLPLCRVFVLMTLILIAYPRLYGQAQLPDLNQIVFGVAGRFDRLINLLFFAGLFLPAIPGARKFAGLILPVQGMAGVALVFSWATPAHESLRLLPDANQWLLLATFSALAMCCAWLLTRAVDDPVRRHDLYDLLLLWLQAPVLLVYGKILGSQLT